MAQLGNTQADIDRQDEFNNFMISKGAFKMVDGQLLVNPDYKYSFESLLLEYKKR